MILLAEHDQPSLAAKNKQQHVALGKATSTPKNRVWGFESTAPGRPAVEPDLSSETATGSVQYSYENASGRGYYYTRDHLGSVREMCSSTGTITSRMAYDPYGRTTTVSGTILPTKQYAGYYQHAASGLSLTKYRAYDANDGRWMSRDFIGENGGMNIYGYCRQSPIQCLDPLGLSPTFDVTITPGFFTHPSFVVSVHDPCCKHIDIYQAIRQNTVFHPGWHLDPEPTDGDGSYSSSPDPHGGGATTGGDAPGYGPDDGSGGTSFADRSAAAVNYAIYGPIFGTLISEFKVCAVCTDGGKKTLLGCVTFWTFGNLIGGFGVGGGSGIPGGPLQ